MLRKWRALFQTYFISSLEYRSEMLMWLILALVPLMILLLVWQSLLQGQATLRGYELGQIVQYYLMVIFINETTASHFENWRVTQIREGKIDHFMTRPLSFLQDILMGDLARKALYLILTLPIYIVAWIMISKVWPGPQLILNFQTVSTTVFLLAGTYLIEFLLALIIVILGFWIEGSEGLEHFKWLSISLFSGWLIPIVFMPLWLQKWVSYLPFKYMFAVPIGILQGTHTLDWGGYVYVLSFVIWLWLLAMWLWHFARQKYASAGG